MSDEKEKIDTLIVSDIHLGSRLSNADKLIETIIKYEYKRLILNGDILDGFNLKRLHTDHWDFLSFLRRLSKNKEIVWVEGNHDIGAEKLSVLIGARVYNHYSWKENNIKYIAIHGHQFDRLGHRNIFLGMLGLLMYFIFHSLLGKFKIYSFLAGKIDGKWLRMSEQVAKGACYYAKTRSANIVFCGHTHLTMESELAGVKYYNSGSWTEYPYSYITIKNDLVEIRKTN